MTTTLESLRRSIAKLEAAGHSPDSQPLKSYKQQLSALESNPQGGTAKQHYLAGARGSSKRR